MNKIDIMTGTYEFAHGKSPKGRGQWAFNFIAAAKYEYSDRMEFAPSNLTYAAAKSWATKHGKLIGAEVISVLP